MYEFARLVHCKHTRLYILEGCVYIQSRFISADAAEQFPSAHAHTLSIVYISADMHANPAAKFL